MSEEVVKFKGSKSGLQLVLNDAADFSAVEKEIKDKLESGSNFFCKGTIIQIVSKSLQAEQRETLAALFHRYGVVLQNAALTAAIPAEPTDPAEAAKNVEKPAVGTMQEMMVIDRTLRGGQEITCKGSVLICGNVNPGAQIIAGGSIDIRGTCRGIVHAGAYGDTKAFVIADHLMPMQIRIADLIARSPDQVEKADCAERASIKNGQIVIEPIER